LFLGWFGDLFGNHRKAYAASKFLVPNQETQRKIDDIVSTVTLEEPVCGFHLRRGDKLLGEAKKQPTEKYLELAKSSGLQCKTCFIASDEIVGAVADVKQIIGTYFPECNIQHLVDPPIQEGYGNRSKLFRTALLVNLIHML